MFGSCHLESGLDDGETGSSDGFNLAGNGRFNRLRCLFKGFIDVVITRPNVISQFCIAKGHLASILGSHAKTGQHVCVDRGILHELLDVDAHFFIQGYNPVIDLLGIVAKTSPETCRDAIPFNRSANELREFLNGCVNPLDDFLDDIDQAGHVDGGATGILAHLFHTGAGASGRGVHTS